MVSCELSINSYGLFVLIGGNMFDWDTKDLGAREAFSPSLDGVFKKEAAEAGLGYSSTMLFIPALNARFF